MLNEHVHQLMRLGEPEIEEARENVGGRRRGGLYQCPESVHDA